MLSVVIPTLDAQAGLAATLASLAPARAARLIAQVVVSDGGSGDGTLALAARSGAQVVTGPPSRGGQLARGVAAATHPWLLILHADTRLLPGWEAAVSAHIASPDGVGIAGYGRLRFDDDSRSARRVEWLAMIRARHWGLPYGDQGLLLSRALYDAVGGFAPVPLMEDVAIVRALGRRRLRCLEMTALTSAERYRRDGWIARPLRNLSCLVLYCLGVPPDRLVAYYTRSYRPP